MLTISLVLSTFWSLVVVVLWFWKQTLLRHTWQEPYFAELAILIESDDWGPGGDFHATRLSGLLGVLARHRDSSGRRAVLTADMVLAVPDTTAMRSNGYAGYIRRTLDQGFGNIMDAINAGMQEGTFVPQLHGMEHLNGAALARLAASGDERVLKHFSEDDWWDWESLDSPLQGHYVDGSRLPTTALSSHEYEQIIQAAANVFEQLFGIESRSAVAPCYLWNNDVERVWAQQDIRYIQTAGYRCTSRDASGNYIQEPAIIRPGDRTAHGQIYLVRNAMYEPVDGREREACIKQIMRAHDQGLPAVISTHRYNYTRSEDEYRSSLAGLDHILSAMERQYSNIRYLSSPELGDAIEEPGVPLQEPCTGKSRPALTPLHGLGKFSGFCHRLWQRHYKLRYTMIVTGLIIPLYIIAAVGRHLRR